MAKFIAIRIHDGYMTWDDLNGKKSAFVAMVKEAYKTMYPDEEIPA